MDKMETIRRLVDEVIAVEVTEENAVDMAGDLRSLEVALSDRRKIVASEIPAGTIGQRWRMEQGKRAIRTYNFSGLLSVIMREMRFESFVAALRWLIANKVVKVEWQWTPLEKLIKANNLAVVKTQNADVADGDEAHIGERWVDGYPSYKPVESELPS